MWHIQPIVTHVLSCAVPAYGYGHPRQSTMLKDYLLGLVCGQVVLSMSGFLHLFARCRWQVVGKKPFRLKNKLIGVDTTTTDLRVEIVDRAKFRRRTKGVIKLHLLLDDDGYLPAFAIITEGNVSDVRVVRQFHFDPGSIVLDEQDYNDYALVGVLGRVLCFTHERQRPLQSYRRERSSPKPTNHCVLTI